MNFSVIGFLIGFLIIFTVLYTVYVNRNNKSKTSSSNDHSLRVDEPKHFPVNYSNGKMDELNEVLNNRTIDYLMVESKLQNTAEQDAGYSQTNNEMICLLFKAVETLQNSVDKLLTNNENRSYKIMDEEINNFKSRLYKVKNNISSMETEFTDFKNDHNNMLSRIEKNGDQIFRKYGKLKTKIGIIERDVSKNTMSLHGLDYSYLTLLATACSGSLAVSNTRVAAESRPPAVNATTPTVAVFQPASFAPKPPAPPPSSPLSPSPSGVDCRMTRFTQNMYDRISITEELVKDAKSRLKPTTGRPQTAVGVHSPSSSPLEALSRTYSDGDTITLTPRTHFESTA